jgi:hypothetical protein
MAETMQAFSPGERFMTIVNGKARVWVVGPTGVPLEDTRTYRAQGGDDYEGPYGYGSQLR